MATWPTEQKSNTQALNTVQDEIYGGATGETALPTVAAAGSTNADAAALVVGRNVVTAADGTKGVILPTAAAGKTVRVKNNANAVLKVYPNSGDQINALTVTTGAISMAAFTSADFDAYDATHWYTTPLVPS